MWFWKTKNPSHFWAFLILTFPQNILPPQLKFSCLSDTYKDLLQKSLGISQRGGHCYQITSCPDLLRSESYWLKRDAIFRRVSLQDWEISLLDRCVWLLGARLFDLHICCVSICIFVVFDIQNGIIWRQKTYDDMGKITGVRRYSGVFTTEQAPVSNNLQQLLVNPFGLRIIFFSMTTLGSVK